MEMGCLLGRRPSARSITVAWRFPHSLMIAEWWLKDSGPGRNDFDLFFQEFNDWCTVHLEDGRELSLKLCVLNGTMRTDMTEHRTACMLQSVSLPSPVGELLLSGCEKGVHTITITMETAHSAVCCADVELNAELQQCVLWLQSYFSSADSVTSLTPPAIHHPLLHTDSFSARVLRTLQDRVSVGQTVSYKQLAEMAGNERAVRAVGGAMRRNPVPLLIPCHRVLCSSGAIGGFMGGKGTEIKRWLLQHENPDHLKTPQNVSNPDYS